jgi:hypothetical protein
MPYSFETKLAEVLHEIKMRKQVYPGSVAARRMTQSQAEMKIDIMEEIAADYERAIERRMEKQEQKEWDSSSVADADDNAAKSR